MAVREKWAGCLKYGWFGCLGVIAISLVIGSIVVGLALNAGSKESRFEPVDSSQQVGTPRVDRIHPSETGDEAAALPLDTDRIARTGRIVLDVSMCRFRVEPAPVGEPIQVKGEYDATFFELEQRFTEGDDEEWVYKLSFNRRGLSAFFVEHEASRNRVRLYVPKDLPIVLEGRVGLGETEMDLGGLHILSADLALGTGEHEIDFSRPLVEPMQFLYLDGSIGETTIRELGNASPSSFKFQHSIGETTVDLDGEWQNDAVIDYRCGIGSCVLRVPDRDVGLVLEDAGVLIGDSQLSRVQDWPPAAPGRPTLTLSITAQVGEVSVRR